MGWFSVRLANKVALITGAASGIGRATACLFAEQGAGVAVIDRDCTAGQAVVDAIHATGGVAEFFPADVTRPDEVKLAVSNVLSRLERIDVLFNNAGISCVGTLHETSEEDWDRVMAVNVRGIYLVTREVVPHMMRREAGVILNMSSCIAITGLGQRAAYAASKGAVYSMTRSMQVDYAPYGIRVNAILPGTIYTPFVENYLQRSYADPEAALVQLRKRQLNGQLGSPEDVAYAALYLASDEAKFIIGAGLIIDGGVSAGK